MPSNIDQVELSLNGFDVTSCIKRYTMHYDMFGGAGSFTCDLVSDQNQIRSFSDLGLDLSLGKHEVFFQWTFNSIPWMNGYLDKVEIGYDKNNMTQTLSGRDLMAVLMDNTIINPQNIPALSSGLNEIGDAGTLNSLLETMWFNNTQVSKITNMNNGFENAIITLDQPLSIRKYLNNTPFIYAPAAAQALAGMPHFRRISFSVGQSLFDVASNLCNQRGLIMYNPPGTNYILVQTAGFNAQTDPNGSRGGELIGFDPWGETDNGDIDIYFYNVIKGPQQNNVISCSAKQDITGYHKYIKLLGEALDSSEIQKEVAPNGVPFKPLRIERIDSIPDLNSDGTPFEGSVSPTFLRQGYSGVVKLKTQSVDSVDTYTWSKTRNLLINNDLFTQNRELYNIKYTVSNHSLNGSLPYFFGQYATVWDDFLNLDGQLFLVYAVTYTGSKVEGLKTEVELATPIADNGRPFYGVS